MGSVSNEEERIQRKGAKAQRKSIESQGKVGPGLVKGLTEIHVEMKEVAQRSLN
jgi:hypothetical protein